MKTKIPAAAALVLISIIIPLSAEEIDLTEVVNSAVDRDEHMEILFSRREVQQLQNQLEDYKNGLVIKTGTDQEGLTLSGIGNKDGQTITASPYAEVILPESIGTSIKAGVPITVKTTTGSPEIAASVSINQKINELLGIEKQNTAKDARRAAEIENFERQIELRKNTVEKELLELIKELSSLNKSIITNETSLYEKESLLENKLRGGMMLRNGSLHLSSLMEIRSLEIETARYRINFTSKIDRFYGLTGIPLSEAPSLSLIKTPELPEMENAYFRSINEQAADIMIKEAELSDLKAETPPQLNLNMSGILKTTAAATPEISGGITGVFEDFSLSLEGGWNESSGGSLTAGVSLSFADKEKKEFNRRIAEYNLYIAGLNMDITGKTINESIREVETAIKQIESSEKNLEISGAFIDKYLGEMEDKFLNGLIPEIEVIKARDQKRLLDIDRQILNIDRYLLLNSISALVEG